MGRRRFDRSAHLTIWALHLLRSSLECVECSREQRRDLLSLHLSLTDLHIHNVESTSRSKYVEQSASISRSLWPRSIHPSQALMSPPRTSDSGKLSTNYNLAWIFGAIEWMRFFRLFLHQAKLNIIFSQEANWMTCNLNTCTTSSWAIFPANPNIRNSPFVWGV